MALQALHVIRSALQGSILRQVANPGSGPNLPSFYREFTFTM